MNSQFLQTMITPSDLITLPYTPDLTPAGISYACRSLSYTYDRMGSSRDARLRRIVAGIAVELAFRRHLADEGVPHDLLGATPFTEPDRYDIALGGRRCDIKSYMLRQKEMIRQIRAEPEKLLIAHALVPVDQLESDHLHNEDLYIFAFLAALITPNQADLDRALAAEQPVFLIHPFPKHWARPPHWRPLGNLVMKSDLSEPIELEIGGQGSERTFNVENVRLPPRERVRLESSWHAVSYLSVPQLPPGRVGVHSPILSETYIIQPHEWGNIWVYGMEITLAGYMTRGEFRRRGKRLPKGSRVFQYPRTRTDNMAV
ncbi:MAG: hypothetical protein ACE5GO_11110, partial [Anaerolineales bacterium]